MPAELCIISTLICFKVFCTSYVLRFVCAFCRASFDLGSYFHLAPSLFDLVLFLQYLFPVCLPFSFFPMVLFLCILGITSSNLKAELEALLSHFCIICRFKAFIFCSLFVIKYRKGYVCLLVMVFGLRSIGICPNLIIVDIRFEFIVIK